MAGLQAVQNLAGGRPFLPILSNILLQASGDTLQLTATNLDVAVSCAVQASVEREGSTTVQGKKLCGIVRELASPELTLDTNDQHRTLLRCGSGQFWLPGLPPEEFPPPLKHEPKHVLVLPQPKLKKVLRQVSACSSTLTVAYVHLCGVLFELRYKVLTIFAADGRMLGFVDIPVSEKGVQLANVPSVAINEVVRSLGDDDVSISMADNSAVFTLFAGESSPQITVTTKLLEGGSPAYRTIVPASIATSATANREEVIGALRRAEVVIGDKPSGVNLRLADNAVGLTVEVDGGGANESIPAKITGEPIDLLISPRYLLTALSQSDDDTATIGVPPAEFASKLVAIRSGDLFYAIMRMYPPGTPIGAKEGA